MEGMVLAKIGQIVVKNSWKALVMSKLSFIEIPIAQKL